MSDKKGDITYVMSKNWLIGIFLLYIFIMLVGAAWIVYIICNPIEDGKIELISLISSIALSAMTSTIRYTKKLYKACVNRKINIEIDSTNSVEEIGNILYFTLRPVFAVMFTIIFVFAVSGGLIMVIDGEGTSLNEKYIYVCGLCSACIGYSVGKVLDRFETYSTNVINSINNKKDSDTI